MNKCTECGKFRKWEELSIKYWNPGGWSPDEELICEFCWGNSFRELQEEVVNESENRETN